MTAGGSWGLSRGLGRAHYRSVQASLLYFSGCPGWQEAGARLRAALDRLGRSDVSIDLVAVESATAAGFRGSPTILVDGADLFPGGVRSEELTCRVYRGRNGLTGVPEMDDLVTALRERSGS